MPFIASNGLTEAASSKSIAAGGMNVHYHEVGDGEPALFLHSYGPGTTAWITFHKALGELSRHYRCILMDLPNFSKTGPIIHREGVHGLQAASAAPTCSGCSTNSLPIAYHASFAVRDLGVIKRVAGTYRYYLTRIGRAATAALCRVTQTVIIPALA
jgi:pimeloyl-ACP methyl ester carboxylesterase